jgi:hypothetical protein
MSCSCINKLSDDKILHEELKKAICLLNNYIYTLKINKKLMLKSTCEIHIPKCLLHLIKKLITTNFTCHAACCINKYDNICDTHKSNRDIGDQIKNCVNCNDSSDPPKYAFYCDPESMKTIKLSRKDIIPFIDCDSDDTFLRSINQLIYKYEGFVHFFTKINEMIEDITTSENRKV